MMAIYTINITYTLLYKTVRNKIKYEKRNNNDNLNYAFYIEKR